MAQNQLNHPEGNLEFLVRKDITDEIYRAAKIPEIDWLRRAVSRFAEKPVNRFSGLIVEFDNDIRKNGFVAASRSILRKLTGEVNVDGQELIPSAGPLIIASNHPGTYDGLAIISQLPRNDFRLIVSGIPFFQNLPNASRHLIFATHDTSDRMDVMRKSIRHLKDGGALFIFPSGRLDPDPSLYTDAADGLKRWSRSIEVFLKKVPQAQLVLTIVSGVLSHQFKNHLLPRLFKNDHERRRIMEFLQVIHQMALGKALELHPKVSFGKPISSEMLFHDADSPMAQMILNLAMSLLSEHQSRYYSK